MSDKAKMTPGPWIYNGRHTIRGVAQVENEADARAIACLPELVEAARDVMFFCENMNPKEGWLEPWANLRRILAKIEGE